jgi:uncharacterized sulfatase
MRPLFVVIALVLFVDGCSRPTSEKENIRPNILFVITDDQSWEHAGCYGDRVARTPAIDQLAKDGIRFENAYCAAPSCTPSRAGVLTGQDIYRLEEGGVLTGFLRKKFKVFPLLLEENGYFVGGTGKRFAPMTPNIRDAYDSPTGKTFTGKRIEAPKGISTHDHEANFNSFLEEVPEDQPFFFWIGITEPHIPHPQGMGLGTGIDTSKIRVPAFYPDAPEIRLALSDYMAEIEWADKTLEKIIRSLEQKGFKENTLIVVTSDNGMPFPRGKATLYDHGVRVPLVISWDRKIKGGRLVTDPVSLTDLAPTFLEMAGVDMPGQMTGNSLTKILFSDSSGKVDPQREFVVTAFEKHTLARPDSMGFPRRALHTDEWTYIRNFEPDRLPAGNPETVIPNWGSYGDVDPTIIKSYYLNNKDNLKFKPLFDLSFGRVPAEELYNKNGDPDMINNLASNPKYLMKLEELRKNLEDYLVSNDDPRMKGQSPWDDYNLDK